MVGAETQTSKTTYTHPLDTQAYSGNDLGATYTPEQTTFKVWSPEATRVRLRLYSKGSANEEGERVLLTKDMELGEQGVWSTTVEGDQKNVYYTYLVTVGETTNETGDIYAKAAGVNGNRSMVVDLDSTDPEGWAEDQHILYDNPTDAVVWEVHVRDFSIDTSSGVSEKNRGKYLAFTEMGTTLNGSGDISTCVDYLKELGVTHVQLLPVYDYATVDETKLDEDQFNWGYDPKNYNVPEGSYSSNPYDGNVRITEFKQMIQALHNADIAVIMDVVYNHTYTAEGGAFEMTVPGYYYRMNEDGSFSDGSGCGNETASDHLMYRKYMVDSILYWINEYHIDGFRFDLMGVHDVETMNTIRAEVDKLPNGKKIILYGEPWTGGDVGTTVDTCVQSNISKLNERIGAFNNIMRDAIKGDVFIGEKGGFVQGVGNNSLVQSGIAANSLSSLISNWAKQPSQTVTYTSAHDNYTLYDKLVLSYKKDDSYDVRDEDLVAMNKLSAAMVLTSQGISFMQAGEEFARTKLGDENSYASSTEINALKWTSLQKYADLVSYYEGLMQIRSNFKPFRDATTNSAKQIVFSDVDNQKLVAYTLENTLTADKEWKQIAVIFNAEETAQTVELKAQSGKNLPEEWVIIANDLSAGIKNLGEVKGSTITVPARCAMVLVDKSSFESVALTDDKGMVKVEHKDAATNEIIKEEILTGKIGSSYTTQKADLGLAYDYNSVSGAAKGKFTAETQTVTYTYDRFDGAVCTLTVQYLQEGDKEFGTKDSAVAETQVIQGREGTDYTAVIKQIDGMEVDLQKFPNNALGTFGKEDITVTYYYKAKADKGLIIHFAAPEDWEKVGAYVYQSTQTGNTPLSDKLPGTQMTADGNGWYTLTIPDVGNTKNVKVYFTDMTISGMKDRGEDNSGYSVSGEVWIQDGKVIPQGAVYAVYVDQNGTILDTNAIYGKADGTTAYKMEQKNFDGLVLTASTTNTEGIYTEEPIYVIYMYDKPVKKEVPKGAKIALFACIGGAAVALIASGIVALVSKKRRR